MHGLLGITAAELWSLTWGRGNTDVLLRREPHQFPRARMQDAGALHTLASKTITQQPSSPGEHLHFPCQVSLCRSFPLFVTDWPK